MNVLEIIGLVTSLWYAGKFLYFITEMTDSQSRHDHEAGLK